MDTASMPLELAAVLGPGETPPADARVVVALSGGLDSATCLAWARSRGAECHSVSFAYGQRHGAELHAAEWLAAELGATSHRVLTLDGAAFSGSALIDSAIAVPDSGAAAPGSIPVTYVPARNSVFLALALALAESLDAGWIVIGANAVDYSGYPDCRPAFIERFQALANVATRAVDGQGRGIRVAAPLIRLSKAEIITLGMQLGVPYQRTVSCYRADPGGAACGRCESCVLRRQGFAAAGVMDPTRYTA